VLANGKVIGTHTVPLEPDALLDLETAIPPGLTHGQQAVTITYLPHADSITAAVFEVRTITRP
jgi:hypothetical protein